MPRSRPKCSASSYEARSVARSPTTCRRRSGSRWGPKPTRPGSSTARARRQRTAALTRCCATMHAWRLLLAHDGHWRGRQIIPAAWIEDATRVRPDQPQPGTGGYGYQVWILPGERRMFRLSGIRGQAIYIDPTSRLVMVHTAVRKQWRDPGIREANALWQSLVRELGD